MIVAVKNLVAERARFVLSVIGVAVAVILVLVMSGIFVGTTNQVTTYIDHSKGAVWVVQPGVSQMFRAVSWLPGDGKDRLLKVPGVQSASQYSVFHRTSCTRVATPHTLLSAMTLPPG
ncbi:Probable ABC transporter%2C permease protein [Mycobacteroides abscessus]|nr:Probable ABC transporter%2C permease protein [Mycobacteroides abscessus]